MKSNSCNFLSILLIVFSFSNTNGQQFTEVSEADFVKLGNSKAGFGDFDNDNDLDIFICGTDNLNQDTSILYRNNGDNSFTDMLLPFPGIDYGSVAWGDYDKDGDLDLLISGRNDITNRITHLYRNDGTGTFAKTADSFTGLAYSSVSFHDYDNDGDLDILTCGSDIDNKKTSNIYRNNNGNFQLDSTPIIIGLDQGMAAWGDYNNDGLSDLILSGSNDANAKITRIYKNNGDRTFTALNIPGLTNVTSSSVAWGDYDNDGDLDVLLAGLDNLNTHVCRVFRNTGGNTFNHTSTAILTGVSSCSAVWGDYDNDGWLDILASGFDGTVASTKVYKNNANHTFTALTFTAAGLPNTFLGVSIWGDFDKDLDLDVFITGFGITGLISELYRNTASTANLLPSTPLGLTEVTDDDEALLKWNPCTDNTTPSKALSYNLWIGTSKNDVSFLSPHSNTGTGFCKLVTLGNANTDTLAIIKNLPQGKYYWSVQAMDNSYQTSLFAPTDSFSICRKFSLGNDTIVCYKDTITLNAGASGETVNWFKASGSGVIAMNQLQVKEEITQKDTLWANIINSIAGCSTFDTIVVDTNPVSIISAGNDTSICINKAITLGGNPTAQGSLLGYTYEWSPALLLDDPAASNPISTPQNPTQFRLIVKAGECKGDTAFVTVSINSLPVIEASSDTTIGPGEPVQLNASGGISYSWSPGNSLSNSLLVNPIATPNESTEYVVTGTDVNGCEDTAKVMIHVINRLFIPNLFSPDNNGSNDVFKIYGAGIKEIDFRIYNRQSQEVFSSSDPEKLLHIGWDGTYQGETLASQTFVWTLEGKFFDGSEITFNGKKTGTLILRR